MNKIALKQKLKVYISFEKWKPDFYNEFEAFYHSVRFPW